MFVPPAYTQAEARTAIAASMSWTEALRRLGRCPTGGAPAVLKKWAARWEIPTKHFDPNAARGRAARSRRAPLEELLVERSPAKRGSLKKRLYEEGLKERACELCGQGEEWNGRRMALILDHINGVRDDNRLENLRIVCPNCNATLDTHCGRAVQRVSVIRACAGCDASFRVNRPTQRYCSAPCAAKHVPRDGTRQRKAIRPALDVLLVMLDCSGYEAVARRFGVSSAAIRTWISDYGAVPPAGRGRDFHPPPKHPPALTDTDALRALALLADGETTVGVAKALGVGRYVIKDLKSGRTYKHLPRPEGLPRASPGTDGADSLQSTRHAQPAIADRGRHAEAIEEDDEARDRLAG